MVSSRIANTFLSQPHVPGSSPPIVRISCLKLDLMSTLMCDFDLILVFSHDKMASSLCLTCQRVGSALGQQKCTKASSFGRSRPPGVLLVMSVAPSYLCCHHFAAKLKLALARELPGPMPQPGRRRRPFQLLWYTPKDPTSSRFLNGSWIWRFMQAVKGAPPWLDVHGEEGVARDNEVDGCELG